MSRLSGQRHYKSRDQGTGVGHRAEEDKGQEVSS